MDDGSQMSQTRPAGLSLGSMVMLSCVAHLALCIGVILSASSETPFTFAGVVVSTTLQCINAGFFLLGLPVICLAITGVFYGIESHLTYYINYLATTLVVFVFWGAVLLRYGGECEISTGTSSIRQTAFACAVATAFEIFWVLAFFGAVACVLGLVASLRATVRSYHRSGFDRSGEHWEAAARYGDELANVEAMNHKNWVIRARESEGYYLPKQVNGHPGLVEDEKHGGMMLYHVDEGANDTGMRGIAYRSGKNSAQLVPNYEGAPMGSTVAGHDVGDGWVRVPRLIPDAAQLGSSPPPSPPSQVVVSAPLIATPPRQVLVSAPRIAMPPRQVLVPAPRIAQPAIPSRTQDLAAPPTSQSFSHAHWRVTFARGLQLRDEPDIESKTDITIPLGEVFAVDQEVAGDDGVLFLHLADGRGWAFDHRPDLGSVCERLQSL